MNSRIGNGRLSLDNDRSFDITSDIDLRNTQITQLPDGLHVGGGGLLKIFDMKTKRSLRGHYKPYALRKHAYPLRLSGYVLVRLKQEANKSATVEAALIRYLKIRKPK